MMDPPAANERPEEEEEEDEPPAQRRRLLVDRKALEASVRSELKEIFQMDEKTSVSHLPLQPPNRKIL